MVIKRRQCVARGFAGLRPLGDPDDREPHRRDDQAGPLPPTEPEAEEPLGEHGEEDQPGGEDGLYDRQRCERKGADVKRPGSERHQPAHREPLGAKEVGGASQRVPNAHRRCRDRAALLEQKGDARRERAGEGERESEVTAPGIFSLQRS